MIIGYSYNSDEEYGVFEEDGDSMMTPGNPVIDVSILLNGDFHLINTDELCENLENEGLDSENENDIRKYLKDEYGVE